MKKVRIIAAFLLLLILIAVTACNPLGEGEEEAEQYVEVEKGDLFVTVSGSGNIETSEDANLSFGSGGRIARIYVEEGDRVTKGKILAELDTDSLELARDQAQYALTQAEVALIQAELSQKIAEYNLDNVLDQQDGLELALFNAQINVRSAEHHVDETQDIYTWPDIETAQKDVDNAKAFLEYALDQGLPTPTVEYAQRRLDIAEAVLDVKRSTYDTEEVAIAKLQLEAAELAEAQAQKNLDGMNEDIAIKELQIEAARAAVEQNKQAVALARQSLEQTKKDLKEGIITAPFDGMVASITAEEGDTIPSPSVAPRQVISLINPTSMELVVEVDEIDIPDVEVGQEVIITLDALSDEEYSGVVTTIYPVPLEIGGVIVYEVKIELDVPEDSGVRIGMSANADIVLASRTDVLLVPARAISEDSEGNPVVSVVIEDDELEERPVIVGISDGFDTEIISGLKVGETILARSKRP
ncbi:MAG: efflux RND transporter periplasmic adaptor subunit [Chloroflexota bacterium]|nr:efflux RND transporter periplasmic adaptor subunit [Chloroflexota bacterium]